ELSISTECSSDLRAVRSTSGSRNLENPNLVCVEFAKVKPISFFQVIFSFLTSTLSSDCDTHA
ncbi:hypothetical protein P7K49_005557, partial [Saguinus oedipus]